MKEIDKLKRRLKNVERNITEYRMTINEARDLLKEIESLQIPVIEKVTEQETTKVTHIAIMDGGTF